jgi:hypothetical protein
MPSVALQLNRHGLVCYLNICFPYLLEPAAVNRVDSHRTSGVYATAGLNNSSCCSSNAGLAGSLLDDPAPATAVIATGDAQPTSCTPDNATHQYEQTRTSSCLSITAAALNFTSACLLCCSGLQAAYATSWQYDAAPGRSFQHGMA